MNIGFIFPGYEQKKGGVWRYSQGITEALDNDIVKKYAFSTEYCDEKNMQLVSPIYLPNRNGDLFFKEQYVLAKMYEIDILYSYYHALPEFDFKGIKKVLTIHDLTPLVNREWFSNSENVYNYFNQDLRKSAKTVDRVVANSEYTKETIVEYYGLDEKKISVVTPAIEPVLDAYEPTEEDIINVKNKYQIDEEYILSICTLEPRKNLQMLIRAYEMYRDKHSDKNTKLVLTGKLGWKFDSIIAQIKSSKYADDIILTDYVTDVELAILYKGALCFSYISVFEGFGMPILEALSKGKAVLTSNVTSMPEVGGNAVCYCDPYDIESVYCSLEKIIEDDNYRKQLENKSIEQSKLFSYEKSADKLIQVFQELL